MSFHIKSYSIEAFRELLIKYTEATPQVIDEKLLSNYFKDYFSTLQVRTIIVEEDYIDHDFIEDFSAYYVKCFHPYKKTCTRLHFFKEYFDELMFKKFLQGRKKLEKILQSSYVGFIVLRPLPANILGRTCLVTYDSDNGRRKFPIIYQNSANLCGLNLKIETLPFQEQDEVTAACATSALWSAFKATGRLFQHWFPSPVEITSAATMLMPVRSRVLPNTDGLTVEQMAHAIRHIGLEPYLISNPDENTFRLAIHAYLAGKIPPLIILELFGKSNDKEKSIGLHAVTVAGFSLPNGINSNNDELKTLAFLIDKLYVHDDQVGPYARMSLLKENSKFYLSTSWGLNSDFSNIKAIPRGILLPLYNKIRIPFTIPLVDIMNLYYSLLSLPIKNHPIKNWIWDIRLTSINDFKNKVLSSQSINHDLREEILSSTLPRFMWNASARNESDLIIDILFDATDISSGKYILRIDIYNDYIKDIINIILNKDDSIKSVNNIKSVFNKIDNRH